MSCPALHLPFDPVLGSAADRDLVEVTPEVAGWSRAGLRVLRLAPGGSRTLATGDSEVFVLPLSGAVCGPVPRRSRPRRRSRPPSSWSGRDSVFTRVTDFAYVGRDSVADPDQCGGGGGRAAVVAVRDAGCRRRTAPASDVPVEVRGAGQATRQVTNFGVPGVWDHAEQADRPAR